MVEARVVGIGMTSQSGTAQGAPPVALRRSASQCFQPPESRTALRPERSPAAPDREEVQVLGRIREALADPGRLREAGPSARDAVRRDIGTLVDRLERMRMAFPDRPDLLARVGLSNQVLRLLEEACREPLTAAGGGLLQ